MTARNENHLLEAVKDALGKDGRLGKFKAELRAAVMSVLNRNPSNCNGPEVPEETKFINDLIREYLEWNGYKYSEQILTTESGLPHVRTDREEMANQLNVIDDNGSNKIPLLYYIVSAFQKNPT